VRWVPSAAAVVRSVADGGGELLVCPICWSARKLQENALVANARWLVQPRCSIGSDTTMQRSSATDSTGTAEAAGSAQNDKALGTKFAEALGRKDSDTVMTLLDPRIASECPTASAVTTPTVRLSPSSTPTTPNATPTSTTCECSARDSGHADTNCEKSPARGKPQLGALPKAGASPGVLLLCERRSSATDPRGHLEALPALGVVESGCRIPGAADSALGLMIAARNNARFSEGGKHVAHGEVAPRQHVYDGAR
jgi:hypothetical protein